MSSPEPHTIDAWTALVTANRQLLEQIETALKEAHLPKLEWYDILLQIERAGTTGIRPFALKERLLLPQYRMSRLLDRMARDGLVARQNVAGDGRGMTVTLTDKGRHVRRAMWPVYAQVLTDEIETRLTPDQAETLAQLLRRITPEPG